MCIRDRVDTGFAAWKAYTFWRGSDNDKYGELKGRTADEYARKNDQFEKNIKDARDVLASHKTEAKYYEKKKKAKEDSNKKKSKDDRKKAPNQNSGGSGSTDQQHSQLATSDQVCFKCGGKGHTARTCKTGIPQSEWAAYKVLDAQDKKKGKKKAVSAKQHAAKAKDDDDEENSAFGIGLCQVHHCATQGSMAANIADALANLTQGNSDFEFLKECFLLDKALPCLLPFKMRNSL